MKAKTSSASLAITTDIILPSDTNALHGLFGGELLARVDRICCIAAQRHANAICVTVSVNNVSFGKVIPLGSMMTIEAKVSRSFSSSMEVIADVYLENRDSGEKTKVNEAIYTFVAVDNNGKPIPVPEIIPETDLEKQRYQNALQRRQLSLVVAGKLKPKDATELKSLFE
ncbi:acyl-CoA thioesterase [Wenyingzhuangia marina]|uniref:Acyl-CoA hydrolase n=1 Tax=Wenyingzhuangia marina TaxID=1195760 RepID=A0A1M5SKK8_9FLAO|nr:acyl-CoA thioesterase [Wenyingzhuangia marina]GGF62736.1 acyl-CoA thioesterase [Wenyingzhuangia marina]SHH39137.1 Acyl-CoA hydrolase [Wenyingzhuangia marina]